MRIKRVAHCPFEPDCSDDIIESDANGEILRNAISDSGRNKERLKIGFRANELPRPIFLPFRAETERSVDSDPKMKVLREVISRIEIHRSEELTIHCCFCIGI